VKRGLGLLVACAVLAGCGTLRPRAPGPAAVPTDAGSLLASLDRTAAERHGLRAMVRMAIDGPGGSTRSTQVLALEVPAKLRVEILGLLNQAVAVLATDGREFELFRAEDRSVRRGPVYDGLLWEVAKVDLSPEQATSVLLGAPRPSPGLHFSSSEAVAGGGTRLDFADSLGAVRERFDFDPSGQLSQVESLEIGGRVRWEAHYGDLRAVGSQFFPYTLRLVFPDAGSRVAIEFKNVELNPVFPPETFVLRLPGLEPAPPQAP
jgi:hypothetical protein